MLTNLGIMPGSPFVHLRTCGREKRAEVEKETHGRDQKRAEAEKEIMKR
jgi:hypothetical protein